MICLLYWMGKSAQYALDCRRKPLDPLTVKYSFVKFYPPPPPLSEKLDPPHNP